MASKTYTLNLTPVFVVWSAVFVLVAIVNGDAGWLWWAAAPWLFMIGFTVVMTAFAAILIWTKYMQGYPITVTTPRKGRRVVRRSVYR